MHQTPQQNVRELSTMLPPVARARTCVFQHRLAPIAKQWLLMKKRVMQPVSQTQQNWITSNAIHRQALVLAGLRHFILDSQVLPISQMLPRLLEKMCHWTRHIHKTDDLIVWIVVLRA
jgi:hypothetical protein